MVESAGNAPASACLQGKCITCLPRPQWKLASRPGAAPGKLSFGDSAAQAGARLNEKLVRLPGVAPGHPPWRGDILLLNHSRRKVKGPGAITLPARAISTKNKHLLLSCDTNPRFHGGSFGVLGHTSCEALRIVKSGLIHPARLVATRGQTPPAENLGSPAPFYVLCQVTSSRCRLRFVSQCFAFRYRVHFLFRFCMGKQKTLLPFR